MYLKEVSGIFNETEYETVSDNDKLNECTIISVDARIKELLLYNLEYMESICTEEQFDDLLKSIKFIWESDYSDYTIEYCRSENNALFIEWLNVKNFKDYC